MVSQPPEITDLRIDRLGLDGCGFAGSLRVAGGLPGEVWSGRIAEGALEAGRIAAPSEMRVTPPCRHFGACGGCTLQHAAPAFLSEWKAGVITQALKAHRLEAEIRPTRASAPRTRRRATLSARRTRKTTIVGFHGHRSDTLTQISDCHVLDPAIMAAMPGFATLTRIAATRSRPMRIAVTSGPAGLDIDLRNAKPLDAALRDDLASFARAAGLARLSVEGETVALARPPFQAMGTARVVPPPGAFLQATPEGEAALVAAVEEITAGAARIADLFAGCGTFSLPLARHARIHAVEGSAAPLAALAEGWRQATGLKQVTTETRDLFRRPLLPAELGAFDAVVLDPPRAGAEAQTAELARSDLARIAYVSCNPATFARDAALLVRAGFRLDWVQPVDQFLWTGHVELAARLSR